MTGQGVETARTRYKRFKDCVGGCESTNPKESNICARVNLAEGSFMDASTRDWWKESPGEGPPAPARPASDPAGWERQLFTPPGGWLRFESGWLKPDQTLRNLETVVSLLQKAGEGLNTIEDLVEDMSTAVNSALKHGQWGDAPPEELSALVRTRLNQMAEVTRQCRFHGRGLLDGQSGVTGVGTGVIFVRGGANTQTSPTEGYAVVVQHLPTQAWLQGHVPLTEAWLTAEEELFLADGEVFVRCRTRAGESATEFLERLHREVQTAGLELEVGLNAQGLLKIRHHQYGSQQKFKGCSYKTPLLSSKPGKMEWSRRGRDIEGTLAGEPGFGIGRMLVGYLDNTHTSELAAVWRGGRRESDGEVGRLYLIQNALTFQEGEAEGEAPVRLCLPSFHPKQCGRWMDLPSGFGCLDEMRFSTWMEVRDSLHMLFAVSCEVDDWKENVQNWIKRYQGQAMTCLRRGRIGLGLPVAEAPGTREEAEHMAKLLCSLIRKSGGQ